MRNKSIFFQIKALTVIFTFLISSLGIAPNSYAQNSSNLLPFQAIAPTKPYQSILLKGIKVNFDDALKFDFIISEGAFSAAETILETETTKLVKYFLASLAIPESELWVNLSPNEPGRIIADVFAQTEMGRDLLAQDYLLKQLTASLLNPDGKYGQSFWERVHAQVQAQHGDIDIPVETFSKIWITPESAKVYEGDGVAYVVESKLKVLLEADYLVSRKTSEEKVSSDQQQEVNSDIALDAMREIIIPIIEQEVNEGKHFANLRQIYSAFILAAWYKKKMQHTLLNQVYANSEKIEGVDHDDPQAAQKIWAKYTDAFKEGLYDYIKEEYDPTSQEVISRQYFTGGAVLTDEVSYAQLSSAEAKLLNQNTPHSQVTVDLAMNISSPIEPRRLVFRLQDSFEQDDVYRDADRQITHAFNRQPTAVLGRAVGKSIYPKAKEFFLQSYTTFIAQFQDQIVPLGLGKSIWSDILLNSADAIFERFGAEMDKGEVIIDLKQEDDNLVIEFWDNGIGPVELPDGEKSSKKGKVKRADGRDWDYMGFAGDGLDWVVKTKVVHRLDGELSPVIDRKSLDGNQGAVIKMHIPLSSLLLTDKSVRTFVGPENRVDWDGGSIKDQVGHLMETWHKLEEPDKPWGKAESIRTVMQERPHTMNKQAQWLWSLSLIEKDKEPAVQAFYQHLLLHPNSRVRSFAAGVLFMNYINGRTEFVDQLQEAFNNPLASRDAYGLWKVDDNVSDRELIQRKRMAILWFYTFFSGKAYQEAIHQPFKDSRQWLSQQFENLFRNLVSTVQANPDTPLVDISLHNKYSMWEFTMVAAFQVYYRKHFLQVDEPEPEYEFVEYFSLFFRHYYPQVSVETLFHQLVQMVREPSESASSAMTADTQTVIIDASKFPHKAEVAKVLGEQTATIRFGQPIDRIVISAGSKTNIVIGSRREILLILTGKKNKVEREITNLLRSRRVELVQEEPLPVADAVQSTDEGESLLSERFRQKIDIQNRMEQFLRVRLRPVFETMGSFDVFFAAAAEQALSSLSQAEQQDEELARERVQQIMQEHLDVFLNATEQALDDLEADGWTEDEEVKERFRRIVKKMLNERNIASYYGRYGHFDVDDIVVGLQTLHQGVDNIEKWGITEEALGEEVSLGSLIGSAPLPDIVLKRAMDRMQLRPNLPKNANAMKAKLQGKDLQGFREGFQRALLEGSAPIEAMASYYQIPLDEFIYLLVQEPFRQSRMHGIFINRPEHAQHFTAVIEAAHKQIIRILMNSLFVIEVMESHKFKIDKFLGHGADGIVFKAQSPKGQTVVIKINFGDENRPIEEIYEDYTTLEEKLDEEERKLFVANVSLELMEAHRKEKVLVEVNEFLEGEVFENRVIKELTDENVVGRLELVRQVLMREVILDKYGLRHVDHEDLKNYIIIDDNLSVLIDRGGIFGKTRRKAGDKDAHRKQLLLLLWRILTQSIAFDLPIDGRESNEALFLSFFETLDQDDLGRRLFNLIWDSYHSPDVTLPQILEQFERIQEDAVSDAMTHTLLTDHGDNALVSSEESKQASSSAERYYWANKSLIDAIPEEAISSFEEAMKYYDGHKGEFLMLDDRKSPRYRPRPYIGRGYFTEVLAYHPKMPKKRGQAFIAAAGPLNYYELNQKRIDAIPADVLRDPRTAIEYFNKHKLEFTRLDQSHLPSPERKPISRSYFINCIKHHKDFDPARKQTFTFFEGSLHYYERMQDRIDAIPREYFRSPESLMGYYDQHKSDFPQLQGIQGQEGKQRLIGRSYFVKVIFHREDRDQNREGTFNEYAVTLQYYEERKESFDRVPKEILNDPMQLMEYYHKHKEEFPRIGFEDKLEEEKPHITGAYFMAVIVNFMSIPHNKRRLFRQFSSALGYFEKHQKEIEIKIEEIKKTKEGASLTRQDWVTMYLDMVDQLRNLQEPQYSISILYFADVLWAGGYISYSDLIKHRGHFTGVHYALKRQDQVVELIEEAYAKINDPKQMSSDAVAIQVRRIFKTDIKEGGLRERFRKLNKDKKTGEYLPLSPHTMNIYVYGFFMTYGNRVVQALQDDTIDELKEELEGEKINYKSDDEGSARGATTTLSMEEKVQRFKEDMPKLLNQVLARYKKSKEKKSRFDVVVEAFRLFYEGIGEPLIGATPEERESLENTLKEVLNMTALTILIPTHISMHLKSPGLGPEFFKLQRVDELEGRRPMGIDRSQFNDIQNDKQWLLGGRFNRGGWEEAVQGLLEDIEVFQQKDKQKLGNLDDIVDPLVDRFFEQSTTIFNRAYRNLIERKYRKKREAYERAKERGNEEALRRMGGEPSLKEIKAILSVLGAGLDEFAQEVGLLDSFSGIEFAKNARWENVVKHSQPEGGWKRHRFGTIQATLKIHPAFLSEAVYTNEDGRVTVDLFDTFGTGEDNDFSPWGGPWWLNLDEARSRETIKALLKTLIVRYLELHTNYTYDDFEDAKQKPSASDAMTATVSMEEKAQRFKDDMPRLLNRVLKRYKKLKRTKKTRFDVVVEAFRLFYEGIGEPLIGKTAEERESLENVLRETINMNMLQKYLPTRIARKTGASFFELQRVEGIEGKRSWEVGLWEFNDIQNDEQWLLSSVFNKNDWEKDVQRLLENIESILQKSDQGLGNLDDIVDPLVDRYYSQVIEVFNRDYQGLVEMSIRTSKSRAARNGYGYIFTSVASLGAVLPHGLDALMQELDMLGFLAEIKPKRAKVKWIKVFDRLKPKGSWMNRGGAKLITLKMRPEFLSEAVYALGGNVVIGRFNVSETLEDSSFSPWEEPWWFSEDEERVKETIRVILKTLIVEFVELHTEFTYDDFTHKKQKRPAKKVKPTIDKDEKPIAEVEGVDAIVIRRLAENGIEYFSQLRGHNEASLRESFRLNNQEIDKVIEAYLKGTGRLLFKVPLSNYSESKNEQIRSEDHYRQLYWNKGYDWWVSNINSLDIKHLMSISWADIHRFYKSLGSSRLAFNRLREIEGRLSPKGLSLRRYQSGLIEELDLSDTIKNTLHNNGIWALEDLMSFSREELLQLPSIGKKRVEEIEAKLAEKELGLRLDAAMTSDAMNVSDSLGGIDLSSLDMDFRIEGRAGVDCLKESDHQSCINLNVTPEQLQNMRKNLRGITPIIINIQPIPNLPLILGLDQPQEDEEEQLAQGFDLVAVKE